MLEETYIFKSTNKISDIHTVIWKAKDEKPKGIIQISHGMAEHIYRYKEFAKFMTNKGFIVCGNDHAGHGLSSMGHKGFMCEKDGHKYMVEDLNHVYNYMIIMYPGLPYFLLGHSMGSFIARYYCTIYGNELDGVIFAGTKGNDPTTILGLIVCNIMIFLGKGKSKAKFLDKISFKSYNEKFENKRTEFDWLSRDEKIVDEYIEDDNCGFVFSYCAYRDLLNTLKYVSSSTFYDEFKKTLPTYIISGTDDPVGDYSKGVKKVYKNLIDAGVVDVSIDLYESARHELLNEINRDEIFEDILEWITSKKPSI